MYLANNPGEIVNKNLYFNIGLAYSKLGEDEKAVRNYKTALEIEPNFFEALYNLSVLELKYKDYVSAENHALKAYELIPDTSDVVKILVDIYNQNKEFEKANIYLEKLALFDTKDSQKYRNTIQYNGTLRYFENQQYNEAIETLNK